ncbi:ABC transporter permease [Mycobacterium sp. MS1601]|uniref:ABC transporter permease n=1 Tax=Mycobacterium sp. MS1601 TaxID=1936029 RepID=UPI001F2F517A|nr:ABC transporter permease [Mycobacterium sp. MS1601]
MSSCVVALGIWYSVSYLVLTPQRRFLLPPPHQILTRSLLNTEQLRIMLDALWVTARSAALGLLIAAVVGVLVGALMNQGRWIERFMFPYAVAFHVVPILAIVPLIGLWFGFGATSRVVVCAMIALFPIISNTHFGLSSVDRGLHELFDLGRASRLQRLLRLELPSAMPAILAGLQIAAGQAVVGAIIGDMFFARGEPGIGTLIDVYRSQLRSTDLIAAILVASAFGIAVFNLSRFVARRAVGRWHGPRERPTGHNPSSRTQSEEPQ